MPSVEAVEREGGIEWMRGIVRDSVRENVARAWRGLKAARAPAAIKIQAFNFCLADNRAGVWRGIDDAAPLAVHVYARKHGEQLDYGGGGVFDNMRAAALRIAGVMVNPRANHQLPFV